MALAGTEQTQANTAPRIRPWIISCSKVSNSCTGIPALRKNSSSRQEKNTVHKNRLDKILNIAPLAGVGIETIIEQDPF